MSRFRKPQEYAICIMQLGVSETMSNRTKIIICLFEFRFKIFVLLDYKIRN